MFSWIVLKKKKKLNERNEGMGIQGENSRPREVFYDAKSQGQERALSVVETARS